MEHNGELLGREVRRIEVCVDDGRIRTRLQITIIKPFIRELQNGLVRAEILNQFHDP